MIEMDCEVRTNPSLHAKATVTSRGVLSGSFKLTMAGRGMNIEAAFYFPDTIGTEKEEEYDQMLNWVKKIFEQTVPFQKSTIQASAR
jgi:predicted Co/Zn/Cd cation transporter (cation efflux family)